MIRLTPPRNERLERTTQSRSEPGRRRAEHRGHARLPRHTRRSGSRVLPDTGLGPLSSCARRGRTASICRMCGDGAAKSRAAPGSISWKKATDPRPSAVTLRPRQLRDAPRAAGHIRLGGDPRGRRRLPHLRHHPGGQRSCARRNDRRRSRRPTPRACRSSSISTTARSSGPKRRRGPASWRSRRWST